MRNRRWKQRHTSVTLWEHILHMIRMYDGVLKSVHTMSEKLSQKACHTHTHTHTQLVKEESRLPANKYIHVGAGIRHLVDWLTGSKVRLHVYNEDGSNGLFRNAGIYQTTSRLILLDRNCMATACPVSEKTKFYTFTPLPCNRLLNFSV